MLWLILGALAALAAAVFLLALLRRPPTGATRAEHDLEVFRAQLGELARERAAGLIGAAEAEAARTEIERRMLAADAARQAPAGRGPGRWDTALALIVALAVPAAALGLYLWLGSPEAPQRAVAERAGAPPAAPGEPGRAEIDALVARLEQRLAGNPDDLEGWATLARSLAVLGRYARAVEAYDRALALAGEAAPLHSGRGEALVMDAGGQVTDPARLAFERALELDPGDARARYYLAVARQQAGDPRGALDRLAALLAEAPADAPWAGRVREQAAALARTLELDPEAVLPPQGAPAPGEAEPAAQMSEQEQLAMIRGMVEGLARRLQETPDDLRGWRMLARSYRVLGERDQALAAYRRVLELDGQDPDALYALGEAARRAGDPEGAKRYWTRLLAQLAPGSEEHARLRERIDGLP